MPQCYCFPGRSYFEPISPGADWMPTADHYPRLKMQGGHLTPDNVRLGHRVFHGGGSLWKMNLKVVHRRLRAVVVESPARPSLPLSQGAPILR